MQYKVKEYRQKLGISQEKLCEDAGVSRQIVSDLESGKEVNTTTQTLQKIATALNCKVTDIFMS